MDKLEDLFFPTSTLLTDSSRIQAMIDILSPQRTVLYSGLTMAELLKLDFDKECAWSSITVNFFLVLLCFINKEYSNALTFLTAFMKETSMEDNEYYLSVQKLIQSFIVGMDEEERKNNFPSDLLNAFATPSNLFSYISLPQCPNCEHCSLNPYCFTKSHQHNAISIANQMSVNHISNFIF